MARKQSGRMQRFFAHNMLMGGPPGAGKTLLARTVPSILPRMTFEESLTVTKIYSVAGQLPSDTPLIRHRPFRAPHHTISFANQRKRWPGRWRQGARAGRDLAGPSWRALSG